MNSRKNGETKARPSTWRSTDIVSAEIDLQRPLATSATLAINPQVDESVVERWLRSGRNAIPQYERDEELAIWMFRKMEAFARRFAK